MGIVTSFAWMLQEFAVVMHAPTLENFSLLLSGWIFAHRRTVTGMILAAGLEHAKHHSSFHRIFSGAEWSLDHLGLAVFRMIEPWTKGQFVEVIVDDTLAHKRGLKVFGVGMHYDPQISSRGHRLTRWSHNWVVVGVVVRFPLWPTRPLCLPILFRLYLNKKSAVKHRRTYRTRPELALAMLTLLCKHRPSRRFHVLADSAYGGQHLLKHLPTNCGLTSRLLMNARLYASAPPPTGKRGRRRRRGMQLPTPAQMLQQRARRTSVDIYGRKESMRFCDMECRVHAVPDRPLRVVAIESLQGGRGQEAFYSTEVTDTAEQIVTQYARRWSIEQTFHDTKQHLGFEEPQGWSRRAVERTAPVAMALYSLVVLWYVQHGRHHYRPIERPWYHGVHRESFADMLGTLRKATTHEYISELGLAGPGTAKITQLLESMIQLAA